MLPQRLHLLCGANIAENLDLQDGSCRVALGSHDNGDELIATANELEVVRPKKNEFKIMMCDVAWRNISVCAGAPA